MRANRSTTNAERAVAEQELREALLGTAVRFGDAVRRFGNRCRRRGYDYGSSRLLDEVHLSRSLLFALAEELRGGNPVPARPTRRRTRTRG